jgi:MurNAc alpha-1-phosphate uridylyltransferase
MKAMILAAGRGERLRPLTDRLPKPLIEAGGKALITWHLDKLARSGFGEVVINLGHLGETVRETVGNGERFGLAVRYSREPPGALETGGGIHQALPLLGDEPFLLVNGDCWTDLDFAALSLAPGDLAHLVLVNNPDHNPEGDFALEDSRARNSGELMLTYSGVAILHPELFRDCEPGRFPLTPLLRRAADSDRVGGTHYPGTWFDVGTLERLGRLRDRLEAPP